MIEVSDLTTSDRSADSNVYKLRKALCESVGDNTFTIAEKSKEEVDIIINSQDDDPQAQAEHILRFLTKFRDDNPDHPTVFNVWDKDGTTVKRAETDAELGELIAKNLKLPPKEIDDFLSRIDTYATTVTARAAIPQFIQYPDHRSPKRFVISFSDVKPLTRQRADTPRITVGYFE